ncbi:arginine--tRNA ligase [Thermicanus aegyptius]|uniref:arginine--tRNA ligase n=1 Tax=Thermicanus aegyptius TaxID=94009 RepID=UPI0004066417|nr:arginine--tRNA ligase [Thermicanus aegyptius]
MLESYISSILAEKLSLSKEEISSLLEIPPNPGLGDLAFPVFSLAKIERKAPHLIAKEVAEKMTGGPVRAVATGGYVNFFFDRSFFAVKALEEAMKPDFGKEDLGKGKRVIIDMSSPNIAKPFGIGHLRSTMIGNALYHAYKALGYDAVRVNHLGDWGTQFGKQIVAYKRWGDEVKIAQNPIKSYLELYVRFHEEAENNPELEEEARAWFKKLEDGDEEARSLWQRFIQESLKEFKRMYERLHVDFDYYMGESFYNDKMDAVVRELREKGLLEESEGAQVVSLDDRDMPPCIILKSDGSTIYATRDLATAIYRHDVLKGDLLLYVVGAEQSLHFKQVFAVLEKMGREWAKVCIHVPFGLMRFAGKKMSTRKGRVVFLEEVLDEAVERAREIIEEKNPSLPDKERVAEAVGIGAIIFGDLKNNRIHEVDFSLEEALNFDGETGPYVQYTYARTQSVLEKAGEVPTGITEGKSLTRDVAWELLKEILGFPKALKLTVERNEPSVLARYLLNLAKVYNRFYHQERILSEEEEERKVKLALTQITGRILKESLEILGLQTPSKI